LRISLEFTPSKALQRGDASQSSFTRAQPPHPFPRVAVPPLAPPRPRAWAPLASCECRAPPRAGRSAPRARLRGSSTGGRESRRRPWPRANGAWSRQTCCTVGGSHPAVRGRRPAGPVAAVVGRVALGPPGQGHRWLLAEWPRVDFHAHERGDELQARHEPGGRRRAASQARALASDDLAAGGPTVRGWLAGAGDWATAAAAARVRTDGRVRPGSGAGVDLGVGAVRAVARQRQRSCDAVERTAARWRARALVDGRPAAHLLEGRAAHVPLTGTLTRSSPKRGAAPSASSMLVDASRRSSKSSRFRGSLSGW